MSNLVDECEEGEILSESDLSTGPRSVLQGLEDVSSVGEIFSSDSLAGVEKIISPKGVKKDKKCREAAAEPSQSQGQRKNVQPCVSEPRRQRRKRKRRAVSIDSESSSDTEFSVDRLRSEVKIVSNPVSTKPRGRPRKCGKSTQTVAELVAAVSRQNCIPFTVRSLDETVHNLKMRLMNTGLLNCPSSVNSIENTGLVPEEKQDKSLPEESSSVALNVPIAECAVNDELIVKDTSVTNNDMNNSNADESQVPKENVPTLFTLDSTNSLHSSGVESKFVVEEKTVNESLFIKCNSEDSEDNIEALREEALRSSVRRERVSLPKVLDAEEETDPDLLNLRIYALHSAIVRKHQIRLARKAELAASVPQFGGNSGDYDKTTEPVDMDLALSDEELGNQIDQGENVTDNMAYYVPENWAPLAKQTTGVALNYSDDSSASVLSCQAPGQSRTMLGLPSVLTSIEQAFHPAGTSWCCESAAAQSNLIKIPTKGRPKNKKRRLSEQKENESANVFQYSESAPHHEMQNLTIAGSRDNLHSDSTKKNLIDTAYQMALSVPAVQGVFRETEAASVTKMDISSTVPSSMIIEHTHGAFSSSKTSVAVRQCQDTSQVNAARSGVGQVLLVGNQAKPFEDSKKTSLLISKSKKKADEKPCAMTRPITVPVASTSVARNSFPSTVIKKPSYSYQALDNTNSGSIVNRKVVSTVVNDKPNRFVIELGGNETDSEDENCLVQRPGSPLLLQTIVNEQAFSSPKPSGPKAKNVALCGPEFAKTLEEFLKLTRKEHEEKNSELKSRVPSQSTPIPTSSKDGQTPPAVTSSSSLVDTRPRILRKILPKPLVTTRLNTAANVLASMNVTIKPDFRTSAAGKQSMVSRMSRTKSVWQAPAVLATRKYEKWMLPQTGNKTPAFSPAARMKSATKKNRPIAPAATVNPGTSSSNSFNRDTFKPFVFVGTSNYPEGEIAGKGKKIAGVVNDPGKSQCADVASVLAEIKSKEHLTNREIMEVSAKVIDPLAPPVKTDAAVPSTTPAMSGLVADPPLTSVGRSGPMQQTKHVSLSNEVRLKILERSLVDIRVKTRESVQFMKRNVKKSNDVQALIKMKQDIIADNKKVIQQASEAIEKASEIIHGERIVLKNTYEDMLKRGHELKEERRMCSVLKVKCACLGAEVKGSTYKVPSDLEEEIAIPYLDLSDGSDNSEDSLLKLFQGQLTKLKVAQASNASKTVAQGSSATQTKAQASGATKTIAQTSGASKTVAQVSGASKTVAQVSGASKAVASAPGLILVCPPFAQPGPSSSVTTQIATKRVPVDTAGRKSGVMGDTSRGSSEIKHHVMERTLVQSDTVGTQISSTNQVRASTAGPSPSGSLVWLGNTELGNLGQLGPRYMGQLGPRYTGQLGPRYMGQLGLGRGQLLQLRRIPQFQPNPAHQRPMQHVRKGPIEMVSLAPVQQVRPRTAMHLPPRLGVQLLEPGQRIQSVVWNRAHLGPVQQIQLDQFEQMQREAVQLQSTPVLQVLPGPAQLGPPGPAAVASVAKPRISERMVADLVTMMCPYEARGNCEDGVCIFEHKQQGNRCQLASK